MEQGAGTPDAQSDAAKFAARIGSHVENLASCFDVLPVP